MLRTALIFLSNSASVRALATRFPPAQKVARRFVAGERVEDAVQTARELNDSGIKVTLDYLGESVRNEEEARTAADLYVTLIERIHQEKLDANISLKLTQMGQDIGELFLHQNIARVLHQAREHGIFVRFDMEGSDYTEKTLHFHQKIWNEGFNQVGPVIQAYLYRSEDDIDRLNQMGARVRLCKGAYREGPDVAFAKKADTDANYYGLAQMLLRSGTYPAFATHDEQLIQRIRTFAQNEGIDRSSFEFQMLYGVRRDLQQRLVEEGYHVRVYVPFGDAWYPYLMRRMAERPANLAFILNAILKEG